MGVTDGDTITVLLESKKQYKIRLQHIDCPETRQSFGSKAKQFLSQKVFGKNVTVKWDEMGRYKRGDLVVIVAGAPPGTVGSTNLIHVHRIGEDDV